MVLLEMKEIFQKQEIRACEIFFEEY